MAPAGEYFVTRSKKRFETIRRNCFTGKESSVIGGAKSVVVWLSSFIFAISLHRSSSVRLSIDEGGSAVTGRLGRWVSVFAKSYSSRLVLKAEVGWWFGTLDVATTV